MHFHDLNRAQTFLGLVQGRFQRIRAIYHKCLAWFDSVCVLIQVKHEIDEALEEAKKSAPPDIENLWKNTYKDGLGAQLRGMDMWQPKIQL